MSLRPKRDLSKQESNAMARQHKTNRHELTPIERAYLVGRHDAGESFGHISSETSVPKSTIIDTVKNTSEYSDTKSLGYHATDGLSRSTNKSAKIRAAA